ncbi:MAG: transporter substrate-binding domain-containing protein [Alphaproteobacteria bacterium]|nr:transporter substrate-binding domain-containing protein [Alphaproteobacteria bacterium]
MAPHLGTSKIMLLAVAAACAASVALAADQPPVPDAIKKAGVLKIGIKCDYPPDGFLDSQGKNQGIEVSLARQIAADALGDTAKAELTCVTAANRIPMLVGGKIDMLVATLGITEERARVVDFSEPYAWGGSDVLVPKGSPVKKLADLKGKTVVVMKGAWQIDWFEKNMPDVKLLKLDNVSDGLQALLQKRADGFAHDFAILVGIAKKNQNTELVGELYQIGYRGIGVRKGDTALRDYVNAEIKNANDSGKIAEWVKQFVEPELVPATIDTWNLAKVPKTAPKS